jgi:hypothetical protein
MFSLFRDLKPEDRFVAFLATMIVVLFASIAVASMFFPVRSDAEIKQTVIALVMLAAGFYLGSSASGRTKDKVIADMATAPVPPVPSASAPVSTTTTVTDDSTVTKTEPAAAAPAQAPAS